MELVLRIAAAAIPAGLLAASIKKDNPALSLAVVIAAAAAVLLLAGTELDRVAQAISSLTERAGVSVPAVAAVLKALGISLVTRLTSDMLKDAGMNAAASAAELGGTAAGLCVSLPVMLTVLDMMESLL